MLWCGWARLYFRWCTIARDVAPCESMRDCQRKQGVSPILPKSVGWGKFTMTTPVYLCQVAGQHQWLAQCIVQNAFPIFSTVKCTESARVQYAWRYVLGNTLTPGLLVRRCKMFWIHLISITLGKFCSIHLPHKIATGAISKYTYATNNASCPWHMQPTTQFVPDLNWGLGNTLRILSSPSGKAFKVTEARLRYGNPQFIPTQKWEVHA